MRFTYCCPICFEHRIMLLNSISRVRLMLKLLRLTRSGMVNSRIATEWTSERVTTLIFLIWFLTYKIDSTIDVIQN